MSWADRYAAAAPAVLHERSVAAGRLAGLAGTLFIAGQTLPRKRGDVLGRGLRLQCGKRASLRARNPLRRHSVPRKRRAAEPDQPDQKGLTIKGAQACRQAVISIRDKKLTLYAMAPRSRSRWGRAWPSIPPDRHLQRHR